MKNKFGFILVRPQLGENIGASARSIKNFGFKKLSIVAPKFNFPNHKAKTTSVGAFDVINKTKVFSSIDYGGRYSFNNQSFICFWNMLCFANAILPLFDNTKSAAKILELELSNFKKKFTDQWTTDMSLKFGSKKNKIFDEDFFKSWTELLESENLDYTNSFLKLEW